MKKIETSQKKEYNHLFFMDLKKKLEIHFRRLFGNAKRIAAAQHTLTIAEKASHRLKPPQPAAYSLSALKGRENDKE